MSARTAYAVGLLALFASSLVHAQRKTKQESDDDAPIPYSDDNRDDDEKRNLPRRSEPTGERPDETEVEQLDRERSRANEDDPSIGISFEVLVGAMLLESSRAGGVQPSFSGGGRFTWEWTRSLLSDEFTRELGFVDLSYWYAGEGDGTKEVYGHTDFHYFTLAPAIAYPFGKTPFSVYGQLGIGFNFSPSSITIDNTTTHLSGTKFLFQYGLGIRARPLVVNFKNGGAMRISFRFELTRFRRGYMDDTMLGGSIGVTF